MASGSTGSLLVLVLVAGLLGGGGYWLSRGQEDAKVVPASPTPPVVAPGPALPPPAVVTAPLPTPESAGVPVEDCIAYPDGTRLPPLNGVKKAPAMVFHRMVPFTKVIRKELDPRTGVEWYIHENGVRSTTRLQWKDGVQTAFSEIDMPREAAPVADDKD